MAVAIDFRQAVESREGESLGGNSALLAYSKASPAFSDSHPRHTFSWEWHGNTCHDSDRSGTSAKSDSGVNAPVLARSLLQARSLLGNPELMSMPRARVRADVTLVGQTNRERDPASKLHKLSPFVSTTMIHKFHALDDAELGA